MAFENPDFENTFDIGNYAGDGGSPFGQAGIGSATGAPAGTGSWWNQASQYLGSKEGQSALAKVGSSLLGAAGQANPAYLKIAAGAPPTSPGGGNSLLNSILQMQLAQQQARQFPLGQNFRPSLLG